MDMPEPEYLEPAEDIEAEQAVLGAVLLEPEAFDIVEERLKGDEFSRISHQKILGAMRDLADNDQPIDTVTLVQKLQSKDELKHIGGTTYLTQLANASPTAANIESYITILKDKSYLRKARMQISRQYQEMMRSNDAKQLISMMQETAATLSDDVTDTKTFSSIKTVSMSVYEDIEKRYTNRDMKGVTGTPSGFEDLDKMTAGFQNSDLIIVAARPSVGKTAFALNIGQNTARKIDEPVAIFSLEMGEKQLVQRMLCAESAVDASRLRTGYLEGNDWEKLTLGVSKLAEQNIHIDDSAALSVPEIRAKCRRLKKEQGLGLIIIDYLQLLTSSRRRSENRQQEVSEISRGLKQLARELEVPVIALSQLSRGVEQRQDKRPMLSDLRESGSIEQDADIVAFLYRDDYYSKDSEKKGIIEIIISKQRNGPTGTVELAFLKNFNKFVSLDRTHNSTEKENYRDDDNSSDSWHGGYRR